jgi:hypothetical protein
LSTGKYALAIEIEDQLFEIFDILYFEKDSEIDLRYRYGTLGDTKGIYPKDNRKIKISSFWNGIDFISDEEKDYIETDPLQDLYILISNNIVFGGIIKNKNTIENDKYQAAFEGNVILINVSLVDNVGLGDLWDGKKIISIV